MCGLIGCFGANVAALSKTILDSLSHRGPDDHGVFQSENIWLGHARLSIIDLSDAGHQPMSDETGRFTIVFNGEVYNFRELRLQLEARGHRFRTESDTEVVLKAFIEYRNESFSMFRGMFALAIYDRERRELILARDRLGIKPLLYSSQKKHFVFSSELKALMAADLVDKTLDHNALNDLLAFGAVRQPKTVLKNVMQLMPGHFMRIRNDGSMSVGRFCKPFSSIGASLEISYEDAVVELRAKLEEATKYHLISDVEVGCFLSGGVDSTAVLALMSRLVSSPIKSFSIGFDHQSEVHDESLLAEKSAAALGSDFQRHVVTGRQVADVFQDFIRSLDQPSIDGLNTFLVSQITSSEVKVSLSGLGGDEIFAGYHHYSWLPQVFDKTPLFWEKPLRDIYRKFPNRYSLRAILKGESPAVALREVRTIFGLHARGNILRKAAPIELINDPLNPILALRGISLAEIDGYLRDTLLRDVDVVSMWHSLEVRPVLLDHPLVEFALKLPDDFKVRNGRLKAVFIDAVKDLIPEEVWKRGKSGFEMPFAHWMNGALNQQIVSTVQSSSAQMLFCEKWLKKLQGRVEMAKMKRGDWLPVVLAAWCAEHGVHGLD